MTLWLEPKNVSVQLPSLGAAPERAHRFDEKSVNAINAALAARRPLLVRGEPGTGKSQLAVAAAYAMKRPYLSKVIDSHTIAQDLLWRFDAVGRLAEAQLAGAMGRQDENAMKALREKLQLSNYVAPEPLWWALNWEEAQKHASQNKLPIPAHPSGWDCKSDGAVILIDEIDKADSDLPNGLLEVLGQGSFRPPGFDQDICMSDQMPLIVITTNEERALPDAFLRRCLVLQLALPKEENKLIAFLQKRGQDHFPEAHDSVLQKAAEQLAADRAALQKRRLSPPGQAEYLDLVRAVIKSNPEEKLEENQQLELLKTISDYVLQKHPQEDRGEWE